MTQRGVTERVRHGTARLDSMGKTWLATHWMMALYQCSRWFLRRILTSQVSLGHLPDGHGLKIDGFCIGGSGRQA